MPDSHQQVQKDQQNHSSLKKGQDPLEIYGKSFDSRVLLGTAMYPSLPVMKQSVVASGAQIVTLSLRRQSPEQQGGESFWREIQELNVTLLPNTAGCASVKEAVNLAKMSRELFATDWIKLELVGDDYNLQPDLTLLLNAAEILLQDGFKVLPYCTDDLVTCLRLAELGCEVIMPWGSPIGSGQGLLNPYALETLRQRLPDITLIIDAGIGKPSDAVRAFEMGFDAVLLNSAVAQAQDPILMAQAFGQAALSGRGGYLAGCMPKKQFAQPSTPTLGMPFWHQEK